MTKRSEVATSIYSPAYSVEGRLCRCRWANLPSVWRVRRLKASVTQYKRSELRTWDPKWLRLRSAGSLWTRVSGEMKRRQESKSYPLASPAIPLAKPSSPAAKWTRRRKTSAASCSEASRPRYVSLQHKTSPPKKKVLLLSVKFPARLEGIIGPS